MHVSNRWENSLYYVNRNLIRGPPLSTKRHYIFGHGTAERTESLVEGATATARDPRDGNLRLFQNSF